MRANPLVNEVLYGLARTGKAQLDYLALLVVQAIVLFLWWPNTGVVQMLESQHGPDTLAAVIMAIGITTAYHAVRAGAEEFLLPGQHGLRDWACSTNLSLGRILHGYVWGQLVHSLHALALSAPLVLMAFTVSGGAWGAVAWCVAASIIQALFYRLAGAITQISIGQHPTESHFIVRAIVGVVYVVVGWLAPVTSHVAFTLRALGTGAPAQPTGAGIADHWIFMAIYAALSMIAALVLVLLLRARRRAAGPRSGTMAGEAAIS